MRPRIIQGLSAMKPKIAAYQRPLKSPGSWRCHILYSSIYLLSCGNAGFFSVLELLKRNKAARTYRGDLIAIVVRSIINSRRNLSNMMLIDFVLHSRKGVQSNLKSIIRIVSVAHNLITSVSFLFPQSKFSAQQRKGKVYCVFMVL